MNNTPSPLFLLDCTLSLFALPALGLIMAMDKTQHQLQEGTNLPEEIFRGDRLPLLSFPGDRP